MASSAAGLMPGYETTFITKSELSDEGLGLLREKMRKIIGDFSGIIVLEEDWGTKKLAYPIGKETRGHYTMFAYSGKPGVVMELERNLRIHEGVIRFLTVQIEKEFDADEYRTHRASAIAGIKRREEEREARREEREREQRKMDM